MPSLEDVSSRSYPITEPAAMTPSIPCMFHCMCSPGRLIHARAGAIRLTIACDCSCFETSHRLAEIRAREQCGKPRSGRARGIQASFPSAAVSRAPTSASLRSCTNRAASSAIPTFQTTPSHGAFSGLHACRVDALNARRGGGQAIAPTSTPGASAGDRASVLGSGTHAKVRVARKPRRGRCHVTDAKRRFDVGLIRERGSTWMRSGRAACSVDLGEQHFPKRF